MKNFRSLSVKDMSFMKKLVELIKKNENDGVIVKAFNDYYSSYKNNNTYINKFSCGKKYLEKIFKDLKLISLLKPKKDIVNKVVQNNKKTLAESSLRIFKKDNFDKFLLYLEGSSNIYDRIIWLLCNTGRRPDELLRGEMFKVFNTKNKIIFKGISKKRDDRDNEFVIEVIGDNDDIISCHERVKMYMNRVKMNSLRQGLKMRVKKYVDLFGPDVNTHTFRILYANYLFKYRNTEKKLYNYFIRDVLNHKFVVTSLYYSKLMFE